MPLIKYAVNSQSTIKEIVNNIWISNGSAHTISVDDLVIYRMTAICFHMSRRECLDVVHANCWTYWSAICGPDFLKSIIIVDDSLMYNTATKAVVTVEIVISLKAVFLLLQNYVLIKTNTA